MVMQIKHLLLLLNNSLDNEDAVIDQGCDEEDEDEDDDDDDETIEEQPDFSLDGEHDLFSESEETDTSSTEDESTKTKGKRFCTGKYVNSKLHDLKILLPLPACTNTLHLEKAVGQDTDNDIWRDHLHLQAKCHLICFMHHTLMIQLGVIICSFLIFLKFFFTLFLCQTMFLSKFLLLFQLSFLPHGKQT